MAMSTLEIGLFLLIFGAVGACIAAGTTVAFLISNRVTALEVALKFWTQEMEMFSKKAMAMLHSPHTPELDRLIEKDQANNLDEADWKRLLEMATEEEKNLSNPKFERALAAFVSIECRKRLKLAQLPFRKHI